MQKSEVLALARLVTSNGSKGLYGFGTHYFQGATMDIQEQLARTLYMAHTGKKAKTWAKAHPATQGYHLRMAIMIMNEWEVTPHD